MGLKDGCLLDFLHPPEVNWPIENVVVIDNKQV